METVTVFTLTDGGSLSRNLGFTCVISTVTVQTWRGH